MPESETIANLLFFSSRKARNSAPTTAPEPLKAEAIIVERVCAGDEQAFGELYRMFAPLVHGIVLARVPRSEVDDIVQEVFLLAYKNIAAMRDYNAVGGWLAMIARNCATKFYRQAKPTEELSEDLSRDDTAQTAALEILAAIRTLPETYREALILRLVEGMTGAEIAAQIGLTPESVRVNLHRGMKLLREKLR